MLAGLAPAGPATHDAPVGGLSLRPSEVGRVGPLPALRLVVEACCLGLLPALLLVGAVMQAGTVDGAMVDFADYREAARHVVRGESPYPDEARVAAGGGYLYPPFFAWLVAPLLLLSSLGAQVAFTTLGVAAIILALLLLGVRDWRCHGAALLGAPVLYSLHLGTVAPLLILGIAGAWRLRERTPRRAGALIGLIVAVKPFLWPLLAWPLIRRRFGAAAVAAGLAAVAVIGSWAAIGFAGLAGYPALLRLVAEQRAPESYSVAALLDASGVEATTASALGLAVGLGLLAVAFRCVARGTEHGEELALVLCLTAAFAASPIVWSHYFLLLLVPIALASPRFSALWLAPVALHAVPDPSWTGGDLLTIAPLFVAAAGTLAWAAWLASGSRALEG